MGEVGEVGGAEGAGRGPGAGSLAGGVPPASVAVPRPEACAEPVEADVDAGAGVGRAGSVRRCTGADVDLVNGAEAGAVAGPGLAGDTRMPRVGKAAGAGVAGVVDRAVTTGTVGAAEATGAGVETGAETGAGAGAGAGAGTEA
ncbi:hypothetical protein ABZ725_10980 [Streptomyces sp. NPDC006872]|uniref:hypothetical protein n=1 Tax=Streptomyces sp. NPDC006872 TaxID=3155720 RepID=UPI0033C7F42B